MDKSFYKLKVKEVIKETADAASLILEVPSDLEQVFEYKPGQYLTFRFEIKGKEERRSYSMSSSPIDDHLQITVKRIQKGIVSGYINDSIQPGDTVEVMPAQGRFTCNLDRLKRRTFYLFGAGSGITPLMSILKTVLEEEPKSDVYLLYGNRNEETIIFHKELATLTDQYGDQLVVEHILTRPGKKGLAKFFKKTTEKWIGKTGRITPVEMNRFLEENPDKAGDSLYFICGPNNMTDTLEESLTDRGVDKDNIFTEKFIADSSENPKSKKGIEGAHLVAHLDGQVFKTDIPAGKTILEALTLENADPPHSCTSGVCSTCVAKLIKGKVSMNVCYALDESEIANGYILTCQATPDTEDVEIEYEN